MALNLLIRTQMSSICKLADAGFIKDNFDEDNTTIAIDTPRGVLGGSVAAVCAEDYVAVPCNKVLQPIGLFVNDAAGAPFENAPAIASGKVTVVKGMASIEVDIFETQTAADSAVALDYAVGDKLYSSANGLLTKEESTSATVIGIVTKTPSASSPSLGVDMRI
jgi:predicted RecA/RadA family phage recombinase